MINQKTTPGGFAYRPHIEEGEFNDRLRLIEDAIENYTNYTGAESYLELVRIFTESMVEHFGDSLEMSNLQLNNHSLRDSGFNILMDAFASGMLFAQGALAENNTEYSRVAASLSTRRAYMADNTDQTFGSTAPITSRIAKAKMFEIDNRNFWPLEKFLIAQFYANTDDMVNFIKMVYLPNI